MLGFLIHFLSLFALGLWVGGGATLAFVATPAIFVRAPSRRMAGEIVGEILRRFDRYVWACGAIAFFSVGLEFLATPQAPRTVGLRLLLVVAMIALAAYSAFALSPEIRRLRDQLGDDLEKLPREDPHRRAFGRLHGFSVLCLLTEIVFGAFAMALGIMR